MKYSEIQESLRREGNVIKLPVVTRGFNDLRCPKCGRSVDIMKLQRHFCDWICHHCAGLIPDSVIPHDICD